MSLIRKLYRNSVCLAFLLIFLQQSIYKNAVVVRPYPTQGNIQSITLDGDYPLCRRIMTGYTSRTYRIMNPRGVSGFHNIQLANFKQEILATGADWLEIKITAGSEFSTKAPFPVQKSGLTNEIQRYIEPEPEIQSNHPEIVTLANSIAAGATFQAEAVIKILSWVRGNIHYDYTFSLPVDAVSVYRNRSGTCAGFSMLSAALLRAVGIPASYDIGCVTKYGWGTDDRGGLHAWNSVYYPDAGWIASDPQTAQNMLDASHIIRSFDQCGRDGTVITLITEEYKELEIFSNTTTSTYSAWGSMSSAHIPELDGSSVQRKPISVGVNKVGSIVTPTNPQNTLVLPIQVFGCTSDQYWNTETETDWINPKSGWGYENTNYVFNVDGTGLSTGTYVGEITVTGGTYFGPSIIPVELHIVDKIFGLYLPQIAR